MRTKDEELEEAARKYADNIYGGALELAKKYNQNDRETLRKLRNARNNRMTDFQLGAKWQQKQSPWISVKDRLPETSPVYGNASPYVLVFLKEYGFDAIGYYRADGKWVAEFTKNGVHGERPVKVDFWIPIPSIPKGGE